MEEQKQLLFCFQSFISLKLRAGYLKTLCIGSRRESKDKTYQLDLPPPYLLHLFVFIISWAPLP